MKKNKVKKILSISTLFLLFITVLFIVNEAFGLLQTKSSGQMDTSTAKWNIKLNGTDISSGVINNFVIDNISYVENSNVKENHIAPGRSGYFDIILDPGDTEVAIRYDIFVDLESTSYPSNIKFRIENLNKDSSVLTAVNTYSGVISLEDIESKELITLRLYVDWENDESLNESDTELGSERDNTLEIPVKVTLNQYQGETLTSIE